MKKVLVLAVVAMLLGGACTQVQFVEAVGLAMKAEYPAAERAHDLFDRLEWDREQGAQCGEPWPDDVAASGRYCYEGRIVTDTALSEDRHLHVYFHEFAHALDDDAGLLRGFLEEKAPDGCEEISDHACDNMAEYRAEVFERVMMYNASEKLKFFGVPALLHGYDKPEPWMVLLVDGIVADREVPSSVFDVPGHVLDAGVSAGETSLTLTWSPPASDGGSPLLYYKVCRSQALGSPVCVELHKEANRFTFTGLSPATAYEVSISAWNKVGESRRSTGETLTRGVPATTATTTTTPPPSNCHPAYIPCLPNLPGDALNCGNLSSSQKPVQVRTIGVDPYRLDGNKDGRGCTS